jgi:hypothetical protein
MQGLVMGCKSVCNWLDDICKRRRCWRMETVDRVVKDLVQYKANLITWKSRYNLAQAYLSWSRE